MIDETSRWWREERARVLHRGARFVVHRVLDDAGGSFIVKTLGPDRGDERSGALLRHEHQILRELDVENVARPLGLRELDGAPALVLEDAGPSNLTQWLAGLPAELGDFFRVAIQLSDTVARVHALGVHHRDLTPSNVVLSRDARATLVDFGLATKAPSPGSTGIGTLGTLRGALPYLSPEQTGRTGRLVDHRSDLYSLGAIFYELLTGVPPFPTEDPLEVAHRQLARMPVSPSVTNPAVPTILSELVLKLLAKTPEQRYQSAEAVAADLREAERRWRETGTIAPFELASLDFARQLAFPDELYGRDRELAQLAGAVDRVFAGASELWLIRGRAGTGKTSLAETMRAAMVERGGRFATSAGSPHGEAPYALVLDAFGGLVRGLLQEPEAARRAWGGRIADALGPNAAVVTEVLPELEGLIGRPAPAPPLGPVESENRFHLAFQSFAAALATPDQPLALFLDDLQRANEASLKLLQILVADPDARHRLLLVAIRTEEVEPDGRSAGAIEAIRAAAPRVETIELGGLELDGVAALLGDVLRADPERVRPLARLLLAKTAGNPLFIRQLLRSLHRDGLLRFEPTRGSWSWDLAQLQSVAITDNLAELLIGRIRELPAATQELLQVAACVGRPITLGLIAALRKAAPELVAPQLAAAIDAGLLIPDPEAPRDDGVAYRFAHDRVQNAVRALLSADELAELHCQIGRRMLELYPEPELGSRLFEVVDQLDRGASRIADPAERLQLAELNARAGSRARRISAHASALAYLRRGIELLPADVWSARRDLAYALHRNAAESAYLTGHHALAERLVETALALASTAIERADLYDLRVVAAAARGDPAEAIRWGAEGLRPLGIELPAADDLVAVATVQAAISERMGARSPVHFLDHPVTEEPTAVMSMRLLMDLAPSAYFTDEALLSWVIARMVQLSLERGATRQSAYAYTSYGALLITVGEDERGHEFGRLGVELARRLRDPAIEGPAVHVFAAHVNHWRAPLRSSAPLLQRAIAASIEAGDLQFAGLAHAALGACLLSAGVELAQVIEVVERGLTFGRKSNVAVAIPLAYRQMIRCLQGRTTARGSFSDPEFDEGRYLDSIRDNQTALAVYHALRLQAALLFGAHDEAVTAARQVLERLPFVRGLITVADTTFYAALALAATCDRTADETTRDELLAQIEAHQRQLGDRARSCRENFRHRQLLVEAELCRLTARPLEAATRYEAAMAAAAREGFVQDEALANELAGRAYRTLGLSQSAHRCLRAAAGRYARWGAAAKVRALEEEFAELRRLETFTVPSDVGALAGLDLLSIIKAATTIASEADLDHLLERLVGVCVEAASAERGVLVLEEDEGPFVRAAGTASAPASVERTPLERSALVPHALVEHVRRTREALVVCDASCEPRFASDPYVRMREVKAALVIPLVRQTALIGTFYFENNLAPEVFTPARVRVLEVLSAQAASALEISLLVDRLTGEIQERKRAEDRMRFLAEAGTVLAESLDYEATLARVVDQVVPSIADLCLVYLVDDEGQIRRVASAHVDRSREAILAELERQYPPEWAMPPLFTRVLETGEPLLLPVVTADLVAAQTRDEEHARLSSALGPRSLLAVPLVVGAKIFGVICLVAQTAGRYGAADLVLAQELARRASIAIQNARLYADAQGAIRARDEFLSIASHELYTPVTSMKLAIQGVLTGVVPLTPDNVKRAFRVAERQVGRLTRLIEELLDVSRIHAGRLALQLERVELAELVREVIERFAEELERSGTAVTLRVEAEVSGTWDRNRVDQIVTNLLSNAIKFGDGNPVEVLVEQDVETARLVVRDRGIGIPADRLTSIFDRFMRGVPTRNYGGLGLGLYIVRSLAEALGGTVHVQSTPGAGSTFIVELPCEGPASEAQGAGCRDDECKSGPPRR